MRISQMVQQEMHICTYYGMLYDRLRRQSKWDKVFEARGY